MKFISLIQLVTYVSVLVTSAKCNHTMFDLSKSKHIIHSFGNKFIHENRTTRIPQMFKKRINYADETNELLNKINYLLTNQTMFKNVTTNKTFHTRVEFNFDSQLISLLQQMNITIFKIKIRLYSRPDYFLKIKSNLTLSNQIYFNLSLVECVNIPSEDHFVNYCYKRENRTNILHSIMFKLKRVGNYIMCVQFVTNTNRIIHFPNEYLCYDWINDITHDDSTRLRYKPLFIVIMYLMCASILFPIAIFKHFVKRLKIEKKEEIKLKLANGEVNKNSSTSNNSTKSLNNDNSFKKLNFLEILPESDPLINQSSASESNLLINQLNNNININNHQSIRKVVLFDITSTQDSESDNENKDEQNVLFEANHILNDKPWGKSGPVINDNYHNSFKMGRKVSSEMHLNRIRSQHYDSRLTQSVKKTILKNSTSECNTSKTTSNKSIASINKTAFYYESNV